VSKRDKGEVKRREEKALRRVEVSRRNPPIIQYIDERSTLL